MSADTPSINDLDRALRINPLLARFQQIAEKLARQSTPKRPAAPQCAPFHATAPQRAPQPAKNVPQCPKMSHFSQLDLNDPADPSAPTRPNAPHPPTARRPRPPKPLTPNQLRAARLYVAGQPTSAIAQTLHIDRHTFADWKRLPTFQAELRHLLDQQLTTDN
jgi:hypothetical protein